VHTVEVAGWQDLAFDDSAWVPATAHATYGDRPWRKRVSGFPNDSTAQWIWSADRSADDVAYFRYHIVVGEAPLAIQTTTLPTVDVGQPVSEALSATGGGGSYVWSEVASAPLPAFLALTSDGVLMGTPTEAGTYSFEVQVDDGVDTVTQPLSLTVLAAPVGEATLSISPPTTARTSTSTASCSPAPTTGARRARWRCRCSRGSTCSPCAAPTPAGPQA
jgi:hypothetical protein